MDGPGSEVSRRMDPDRAQAVQAIAAAVQAGTYQVDASAVSRKIVQELTTA
jgi:anti-sigma28 factor (negative regulator of flagellin synthesis)